MTNSVVGIYDSPEATVDAIEELLSKGYSPDHISVITRNEQVALIEQETEVNTTSAINEGEPVSFLDRLKNFFAGTDLEPYEEELQAGKYIVLLDNDAETEEEKLNKLSFDNSEVDVIPSQTMNTTVERKKVE